MSTALAYGSSRLLKFATLDYRRGDAVRYDVATEW